VDLARYAELFRTEAREHLAGIDASLARLADGGGRAAIDALFRHVHTIKGMAGAMGYGSVETLAHALESRLGVLRDGEGSTDARTRTLLYDAADALAQHVDDAVDGRADAPVAASLLARLAGEGGEAPVASSELVAVESAPDAARAGLRDARVELRHLDALLELTGELVIARDRLLQLHEGTADRPVRSAVQDLARLVGALQQEVLAARMVPVGQVFDRFPRLVRDLARSLDKSVAFEMSGRELALDRSMLEAIGDPLVHLLRNAVDHGLESAAERLAAGKPATGRVHLSATRERDAIVIAVSDDGRGIDRARVRDRAMADGRLDGSVDALSDDALMALLAQPGFSTADQVTAVSGRGVGIDAVASRVRAMGGRLEMSTDVGAGTTFTLRLPLTLAIVRALLVEVAERTYAVPASHVIEAVEFDDVDRLEEDGAERVVVRSEVLPVVRLRRRFGEAPGTEDGTQLLVVEAAGRRLACAVDAVLGQQEIVVKRLDTVRGAAALFSGATILGDGSPALIVDVGSLA
jgi:two-component system chemotaxis sensor kinase CheA